MNCNYIYISYIILTYYLINILAKRFKNNSRSRSRSPWKKIRRSSTSRSRSPVKRSRSRSPRIGSRNRISSPKREYRYSSNRVQSYGNRKSYNIERSGRNSIVTRRRSSWSRERSRERK